MMASPHPWPPRDPPVSGCAIVHTSCPFLGLHLLGRCGLARRIEIANLTFNQRGGGTLPSRRVLAVFFWCVCDRLRKNCERGLPPTDCQSITGFLSTDKPAHKKTRYCFIHQRRGSSFSRRGMVHCVFPCPWFRSWSMHGIDSHDGTSTRITIAFQFLFLNSQWST